MSERIFDLVAKDAHNLSGPTWTICSVVSSTTIQKVKEELASQIGKPVSSIVLACDELSLTDNAKTLDSYKIRCDKTLLVWTRCMQSKKIILTWHEKSLTVDVFEDETVKEVIERTKQKIMPGGSYRMTLSGRDLAPGEKLYPLVSSGSTVLATVFLDGGETQE